MPGTDDLLMYPSGHGGPAILLAMDAGHPEDAAHTAEAVAALCGGLDYLLAIYFVDDWNRDLSPWPAPQAFGDEHFEGGADRTLSRLSGDILPRLHAAYPGLTEVYTAGYSLAGLFALWVLYASDSFDGAACCSGSLWLSGWQDYMHTAGLRRPGRVYLSLGGREERTDNPWLRTVGDCTRKQLAALRCDPLVTACTFQSNPGGHFADSGKRLARGIYWLLTGQDAKK